MEKLTYKKLYKESSTLGERIFADASFPGKYPTRILWKVESSNWPVARTYCGKPSKNAIDVLLKFCRAASQVGGQYPWTLHYSEVDREKLLLNWTASSHDIPSLFVKNAWFLYHPWGSRAYTALTNFQLPHTIIRRAGLPPAYLPMGANPLLIPERARKLLVQALKENGRGEPKEWNSSKIEA